MSNNEQEQTFKIQPHPATSNNPTERFKGDDAEQTAGLGGSPNLAHLHKQQAGGDATQARGPHVPDESIAQGLEQPKSREELQQLQANLNKE